MASDVLPDELVKEILSPVLSVPDKMFEDTSEPSIFYRFEGGSTSALLVVCKRWLRIATPLLYEVLVVRSTAQAKALARVLANNPEFGTFVRKIRFEGGFGVAAEKILLAAPHLTDIFLRMPIMSSDSSSGLVRALPKVSPKRAVLYNVPLRGMFGGKQDAALFNVLKECIRYKWNQLALVSSTCIYDSRLYASELAQALKEAPSLKHFTVPPVSCLDIKLLLVIAENPSIERINVHDFPPPDVLNEINSSERLRSVLNLPAVTQEPATLHDRNCFPMALASETVRREVWTCIIEWVAHMPSGGRILDDPGPDDKGSTSWDKTPRRCLGVQLMRIMRVSKFLLSVARPILYKYAHVRELTCREHAFIRRLAEEPALRGAVHSLFIEPDVVPSERAALEGMSEMVKLTTNLAGLHVLTRRWGQRTSRICSIDWEGFELLANTAGHSLLEMLNVRITASPKEGEKSPAVFAKFDRLHTLQWKSKAEFMVSPEELAVTENSLPNFERLSSMMYDPSFITVLTGMRLPALHCLMLPVLGVLEVPFLELHGRKIHNLWVEDTSRFPVFDLCPNLKIITIGSETAIPDPTFFSSEQSHQYLEKIVVASCRQDPELGRIRKKLHPQEESSWSTFFELLDLDRFPALREIQIHRIVWPTDEHRMQKNPWWEWVEGVMKKWDVSFTDRMGTRWRPRLMASRVQQ